MVNISTIPPKQRNTAPRENKDYRGKKLTVRVRSCLQSYRRSDRVKILPRSWSSLRRTTEENSTLPQRSSLRNLHSRQHRVSFTLQLAPISNLLTMKTLAVCCNKSLPPFVFRGCLLSQEPHSDRYSRYAQRREEVWLSAREKKKHDSLNLEEKNRREEKRRVEQL